MIRLPWTASTGPHLVLEVTDGCNISCDGCYKSRDGSSRPLSRIFADLRTALAQRSVQTVTLAGAEPTLHPQLAEIVNHLHALRLRSAVLTNGVLLTDDWLRQWKQAGLDLVMLHVDEGQHRPDLSPSPSIEDVNELRLSLARQVVRHGLDAGVSVTIYPSSIAHLPQLMRLIIDAPEISFAFITHHVDVPAVLAGRPLGPRTSNEAVVRVLREEFGLLPFAQVGSGSLSWLSYFVPVLYNGVTVEPVALRAGLMDAALVRLPRLLTGRHLFYCPASPAMVGVQSVLSLAARGRVVRLARLLWRLRRSRLGAKRIVFDNGLELAEDGRPGCLDFCPNPTVRDGRLVPVCVADHAGVT